MNKVFLIGFAWLDRPEMPFTILPECGFFTDEERAKGECEKRNEAEKEVNLLYHEPILVHWSYRECVERVLDYRLK